MSDHAPAPARVPFFSPGAVVGLVIVAIGAVFGAVRMTAGLGAVTNLDDAYPWGLWIGVDVVCGVALAAGGFTTSAFIDIFGKRRFHPLLRPAILTAWLGYAFVGFAVFFDIGRYWNVWRPVFNWQGNSALFEVGMCVMAYLTVLTVEMSPVLLDAALGRLGTEGKLPALLSSLRGPFERLSRWVRAVLPLFIIAGVVLSSMHQSSLGTLMVLVPSKVSPLWYTPILPLLFLLSAIMVGFPMVVLESILSARALGRKPEMELLAPLASYIPWTIGIYGAVRLGDMIVRWPAVVGHHCVTCWMAAGVEILFGLVLPFVLLLNPRVRRSPGWLLGSVSLVIFGLVLNRVNLYIVSFEPPFAEFPYIPAIGELAVTAGIVAAIVLLYRLFVIYFPVLPSMATGPEPAASRPRWRDPEALPTRWGLVYRLVAIALMLGFVAAYTAVHEEAIRGDIEALEWSRSVRPAAEPGALLLDPEHAGRPLGYKRAYELATPLLNARTDFYEPVRFSHTSHDNYTGGDCGVCHHRFSYDAEDCIGESLAEFHLEYMDIRLAGPCSACHDMSEITIQSCASCHTRPSVSDEGNPVGLKGAYHRQCIGCHEQQPATVRAPVDCASCHHPLTPDHEVLVSLPESPSPREVTAECLSCHQDVGADMLRTAHWRWRGHSSHVVGHESEVELGLQNVMNNHSFTAGAGSSGCARCHIGFGWTEEGFDFTAREQIDCLICHDTTATYRKARDGTGAPPPELALAEIARRVGRPSPSNCGACHYHSGGACNAKHGDLEAQHGSDSPGFDVHLGQLRMRCQECHRTTRHQIAGRSVSAPASEGRVQCEDCHGAHPHGISGLLGVHLDWHVSSVSCEACHIPLVARESPTRTWVDFAIAWQSDPQGQRWEMNVVPAYLWYDGTRSVYVVGDTIDPDETVELNRPLGESYDPDARIYPFKVHEARQPYDPGSRVLLAPRTSMEGSRDIDLDEALEAGARSMGIEYSGTYGWTRTRMYTGIHHEVVASAGALGCADCHDAAAVRCARCHATAAGAELPPHRNRIYPSVERRIDFGALGYEGDPARSGGRFRSVLGRGKPLR